MPPTRYALGDTMAAYDTFVDAGTTGALKVVLQGSGVTDAEPVEEAVLDRRLIARVRRTRPRLRVRLPAGANG